MKLLKGVPIAAGLAFATMCSAQNPIAVTVNGQPVQFNDTQPREINGRVLVPLRGVFEQMGAYVHWTDATQTVDATKGTTSVRLRIGDRVGSVNGQNVYLDVPPRLIGGSTMVPLRFVSEALGADVNWNDPSRTVAIVTNNIANNNAVVYNPPAQTTTTTTTTNNNDTQVNTQVQNQRYAMHSTLGVNTVIPVTLDTPLSSDSARPGDPFTATVQTNGASNYAGLPTGTRVEGHVVMARPQSGSEPGVLQLAFDRLRLPDNTAQPIDGSLSGLDTSSVNRDANGVLQAKPGKSTANGNVPIYVGYGAGAGAVIGVLTKGNVLTDAIVGGALGLLFHELQKNQSQPKNVSLATGTSMGVRLNQPISY